MRVTPWEAKKCNPPIAARHAVMLAGRGSGRRVRSYHPRFMSSDPKDWEKSAKPTTSTPCQKQLDSHDPHCQYPCRSSDSLVARESDSRTLMNKSSEATASRCLRSYCVHTKGSIFMATQAPWCMLRLTSERHTARTPFLQQHDHFPFRLAQRTDRLLRVGRMYLVDAGGVHEHGTRIALANPTNVVLDPNHSECLGGAVAFRAHLADWDCSSPLPCPGTPQKRRTAASSYAGVRGDGLAKECVEQLPMHIVHPWFFHRTVTLVSSVGVLMVTCCLVP